MVLNFPKRSSDWVSIWQATRTMTLLSYAGTRATIPIKAVHTLIYTPEKEAAVVKVIVEGGEFYISFQKGIPNLEEKLTYYFTGHKPTEGYWNVPDWYLEQFTKDT